jgi:uncharacterized DUF497 family protein
MAPLPCLTELRSNCIYKQVNDFDPAKDAINLSKRGISLARWVDMDIRAIIRVEPFDYGDPRYRGYGLIDGVGYCLVFTVRNERFQPISLRRAHSKEMRRHVPES